MHHPNIFIFFHLPTISSTDFSMSQYARFSVFQIFRNVALSYVMWVLRRQTGTLLNAFLIFFSFYRHRIMKMLVVFSKVYNHSSTRDASSQHLYFLSFCNNFFNLFFNVGGCRIFRNVSPPYVIWVFRRQTGTLLNALLIFFSFCRHRSMKMLVFFHIELFIFSLINRNLFISMQNRQFAYLNNQTHINNSNPQSKYNCILMPFLSISIIIIIINIIIHHHYLLHHHQD